MRDGVVQPNHSPEKLVGLKARKITLPFSKVKRILRFDNDDV